MSTNCKSERSLLGYDEFEIVRATHHPAIYELTIVDLQDMRARLRQMRDKERTLAREKRREARGKGNPRGGSFPGTAEQPLHRKQIFSAALKRVNKELNRQRSLEARAANVEAARRALALRRAADFVHHPQDGGPSNGGAPPLPNLRRRKGIHPRKVGSIRKANKRAQAIRDSRN